MSSCEQDLSEDGLGEICLRNERLRVSILPDAGGKISKLTDLHTGRNWLWNNPVIPFAQGQYGVDYGAVLDSGGWDEILLSVSPVTLELGDNRNIDIPDHGDLVGQVWAVTRAETEACGDAVCEMSVRGRAAKYQVRRTIRLPHGEPRLEFDYSLTNNDTVSSPWFWSAHALLAAEPDLRIDLPADQAFRIDQLVAKSERAESGSRAWPNLDLACGTALDLSRSFASDSKERRFASKIFVPSPRCGVVDIALEDSTERLSLHYDPAVIPWLGLWINNNTWSGNGSQPYQNLGLEPATAPYDSVVDAIEHDAISWLEPGEQRCWSLAVELHS